MNLILRSVFAASLFISQITMATSVALESSSTGKIAFKPRTAPAVEKHFSDSVVLAAVFDSGLTGADKSWWRNTVVPNLLADRSALIAPEFTSNSIVLKSADGEKKYTLSRQNSDMYINGTKVDLKDLKSFKDYFSRIGAALSSSNPSKTQSRRAPWMFAEAHASVIGGGIPCLDARQTGEGCKLVSVAAGLGALLVGSDLGKNVVGFLSKGYAKAGPELGTLEEMPGRMRVFLTWKTGLIMALFLIAGWNWLHVDQISRIDTSAYNSKGIITAYDSDGTSHPSADLRTIIPKVTGTHGYICLQIFLFCEDLNGFLASPNSSAVLTQDLVELKRSASSIAQFSKGLAEAVPLTDLEDERIFGPR